MSTAHGLSGTLERWAFRMNSSETNLFQSQETSCQKRFSGEWQTKQLGELGTFAKGSGIRRSDLSEDGLPCVLYGELYTRYSGRIDEPVSKVSQEVAQTALSIKSGDLLFAGSGETAEDIGRCAAYLGSSTAFAGGDIIVLTPSGVNSLYLGHLMNHPSVSSQKARMGQGTTIAHIVAHNLAQIRIRIPERAEQRAIATALSDVDGLLDSLDALIAKNQAVKQATMQQLLTGRTRLPGFSGQWEMKRLGDILTFLTTASNPRSDLGDDGGASYIHYGDVHALSYPVLDCARQGLPSIDRALVKRITPVRDSDLVMVDASEDLDGIGKSVEIRGAQDKTVISGLHTILCRGHSQFWATGFKAYLQFIPAFRNKLVRVATGISVYGISKNQLAEITLMLPAKREQAAIAAVLSDMDAEINALERRRDKTAAIKQAMMQELLTGRVRLVEAR